MTDVVIAGAARTAVGSFNGSLSSLPASQLGAVAIREAMQRAKVAAAEVDEAIMGQILIAGAGQNPARQAAVEAGIPYDQTAHTINPTCGSGLRPVAHGPPGVPLRHPRRGGARIREGSGKEGAE